MRWWNRRRRDRGRDPLTDAELGELIRSIDRRRQAAAEALDPPSAERVDEIVAAMLDAESPGGSAHQRRRRRRRFVGAGVVIVLAGGGAVTWAFRQREPAPDPLAVSCHVDTDLGGSQIVVSNDGRSPIELCRECGRRGCRE